MVYNIAVKPEAERKALLAQLIESPLSQYAFYGLNKEMSLPVVLVPLSLPPYRMNNGRTRSEQLEMIADDELDDGFFSKGQENRDAQQRQHGLLVEFAKEGREGSVEPIITVLETQGQREPLIVSPSGVVLNGNRRLSAMRELFDTDPQRHGKFQSVQVAVLPSLTTEQEFDIEVNLQMTPQTLLDYSWVNEALLVEDAIAHGRKASEVAALNRQSPQWVNSTTAALSEARRYLEWSDQSHAYKEVKNKKQFFWDVAKRVKDRPALEAEAARRAAWLLEGSDERKGRVYDFNPVIEGDPLEVIEKVEETLGDLDVAGPAPGNDELELELGADERAIKLTAFIRAADDKGLREVVQSATVDAAEEVLDKQKNAARANKPLKIIKSSRTNLEGLQIHLVPEDDLVQVIAQLKELVILAHRLQDAAEVRLEKSQNKD